MFLLPQLPKFAAADLAAKIGRMSIPEARAERRLDHPFKVFSPTGGAHFTERALDDLRTAIEAIARDYGYPKQRATDLSEFDVRVAAHLRQKLQISSNEAAKPGPWQFLTCVLMPDLVVWRQRKTADAVVNPDNFLDSTNNLFRRLWWRAVIFEDETNIARPFWLLDTLLEDAIQTFYERRSLSGTPHMGTAFGRVYHSTASLLPKAYNMEQIERTAQKWLVRIGENVAFDYLDEQALVHVCAEAFARSIPQPHSDRVTKERIASTVKLPPSHAEVAKPVTPAELPIEKPYPSVDASKAYAFGDVQLRFFNASKGAYSVVTGREFDASEVNLTGPEAKLAEEYFGRERIHLGPVRSNPAAASQRFRLYGTSDLIYLNLVYPKQDRSEIRLYLSAQKGFKPLAGSIWFLFTKKRDLYVGFMTQDDWNKAMAGERRG